jgi:hypothetical protein
VANAVGIKLVNEVLADGRRFHSSR